MIITDNLIDQAEKILLPVGCTFDDSRRHFIKRFETGDLMAVPGSGKTTVLQAKLYCMAQNLPLVGNRGILVLSHTNTAVSELKRLLQKQCPQLFEYPNYIGTIQQFVNKFLALPFYENYYRRNVVFVDAEKYNKECDKYVKTHSGFAATHIKYHFSSNSKHYNQIRFSYDENGTRVLTIGVNGNQPNITVPDTWKNDHKEEENINKVMNYLMQMKVFLMNQGYLHYDDCYFLADSYIRKSPNIVSLLRERFKYVFVDEAQDSQKHQLNLLNSLFIDTDRVVYQLIGDPNQSIFSSHTKDTTLQWTGSNPNYLNNSMRLTSSVARVVNNLVTIKRNAVNEDRYHFRVTGLNRLNAEIAPRLILFNEATMSGLKNKFKELIVQYNLQEEDKTAKHGFHIIGWAASKKDEPDKLHLENIFPEYNYQSVDNPSSSDTLCKVLQDESLSGDFKAAYKIIMDCLLQVLLLMGIITEDGRCINKTILARELSSRSEEEQTRFKIELYNCVSSVASGNCKEAYNRVKPFLTTWASILFGATSNTISNDYLGSEFEVVDNFQREEVKDNDIVIKIGTVHSAKGRTHCATMYVETYFEGKYECEHLMVKRRGVTLNPLFGDDVANNGKFSQLARKMMYVGFSRPTHLLCYASEKQRWSTAHLDKMRDQGWEIIDLTV